MIAVAFIAILVAAASVHREFRAVYLLAALVVAVMGVTDLLAVPAPPDDGTVVLPPLPNVPRF